MPLGNGELLLHEHLDPGYFQPDNPIESATFALQGAPEARTPPDPQSPTINPVMRTQIIREGRHHSTSPRGSNMGFSASRNKTISSKNKNYQPRGVTRRVREQLQQSQSGGSIPEQSSSLYQQAATPKPSRPPKREAEIMRVLTQYNIKLTQDGMNQTPFDPEYTPLGLPKGVAFPSRFRG